VALIYVAIKFEINQINVFLVLRGVGLFESWLRYSSHTGI